jgi:catechol 2,3-dioxygenase-like lactoylglutathione lyase family enzyme
MQLNELAFFTHDVPAMTAFYRRLLGAAPMVEAEGLTIFLAGGVKVLIHRTYTPGPGELPPENHFALAVPEVDGACEALAAQGLTVAAPPRDYDWGRSAYLRDPDGHLIELTQAASV